MTDPTPAPAPKPTVIADVEAFLARFKTPQTAVAAIGMLVSAFGAIGILSAPLTGWLQGILSAVLALIAAIVSRPVTAALVKRAASKAA